METEKYIKEAPSRLALYYLIFILGVIISIPTAILGVSFFSENILELALFTFACIVIAVFFCLIIFFNRQRILKYLFNTVETDLETFAIPAENAVLATINGNSTQAINHISELTRRLLARWTWLSTRKWMLTTTIGVLAVFAAIAGSALLLNQNKLIEKQNTKLDTQNEKLGTQNQLIEKQNEYLQIQNILQESSRRSSLVFELTSILDEIDEELDAANIELMAIQTRGLKDEAGSQPIGETPRRRDIENPPLYRLSARLTGRIVALSRSLRPYRYLDNNSKLLANPLSPERAQLLLSLMDSGIDMEEINHSRVVFDNADLRFANLSEFDFTHIKMKRASLRGSIAGTTVFHYARLDGADFTDANLTNSKFNWSSLSGTRFYCANLSYVDLEDANLENAILMYANLNGIKNWKSIKIKGANIIGIKNAPKGFISWAIKNGATINGENKLDTTTECNRNIS